jgi:hypothetical protein
MVDASYVFGCSDELIITKKKWMSIEEARKHAEKHECDMFDPEAYVMIFRRDDLVTINSVLNSILRHPSITTHESEIVSNLLKELTIRE